MGLNYAVNGPLSVTDCYFSLMSQIYIKAASSQDITVPAAAHLRPVLIICTVNIRMVPSHIKLSYPAGLQAITAAKQRNTCVSRLPDMLMHFSLSITQHYIAGNPYSWRRSSLQSTLYEASIAMRGMSTVALQLPGLMGLARGSQKRHVRSLQWEREKELKEEWARKREEEKGEKALPSPQDCSYWDKREEPPCEPSPRPRAGPEWEDGEKTGWKERRKYAWNEWMQAGMREGMVHMFEVHVYQYLLFPSLRLHWRDCKELKRATEQRRVPWMRNKEASRAQLILCLSWHFHRLLDMSSIRQEQGEKPIHTLSSIQKPVKLENTQDVWKKLN